MLFAVTACAFFGRCCVLLILLLLFTVIQLCFATATNTNAIVNGFNTVVAACEASTRAAEGTA